MVERRHQVEIGDALAGNERQRALRIEPRQADERAADERHGEQRANAHRVVKRHDAQRALAAGVEVLRDMGDRGGPLGPVPSGYSLGT